MKVILAGLFVCCLLNGELLKAAEPQEAVYGQWMIVRELVASSASRLSADEIESLIGASASYGAEEVDFAGEHCERPVYDTYRETERTLMQAHELRPEDIQLNRDTALAVEIGCADGNDEYTAGTWLLVTAHDRLITEVDGVYFELKRLPHNPN